MRRLLPLLIVCGLLEAACSDAGPSSPASPSSLLPAPGPAAGPVLGATIAGSLDGGLNSSSFTPTAVASPAITVVIVGKGITSTIDGGGRFVLLNVPGGTHELQFSGGGVRGSVTVSDVEPGDAIELTVHLSGSDVSLESERRRAGSEEQVEGRVEALVSSPTGSFVVAGRTITTDAATSFIKDGAGAQYRDLAVGQRVHVKGQPAGGSLLARLVTIQNDHVDQPVNVNGLVARFSGSPTAFVLMVNGREIHGDTLTEFFGGSSFTGLVNGARVEVKGLQRNGFVYAARIHVNGGQGDDGDDEDDAGDDADGEFEGVLTAIGSGPFPALVIGGTTVLTNGATELRRRGDRLTFAVLQVGMALEVSATPSGGALVARKLTISGSSFDFDVDGLVGSPVVGSCPLISFNVGSLVMQTTGFTEYKKGACSAIVVGAKVKVRGVQRPGGSSAEATRIDFK